METRKVQITGKSTFVVSLPKKWVNAVNIRNGDSVGITPLPDGTLLVNPNKTVKESLQNKIVILSEDDQMEDLFRKYLGAYLAGYNIIKIRSKDVLPKETRVGVQHFCRTTIGPEIVDESQNYIATRNLLDTSDLTMMKSLRRMQLIAKDMHMINCEALRTGDYSGVKESALRDNDVDKINWMIVRQYNQLLRDLNFADKMGITASEGVGHLLISRTIERVADHAVNISKQLPFAKERLGIEEDLANIITSIMEAMDLAMIAFLKDNVEGANEALSKLSGINTAVIKMKDRIIDSVADRQSLVDLIVIMDSVDRIKSYGNDLSEIAINHHFGLEFGRASAAIKEQLRASGL